MPDDTIIDPTHAERRLREQLERSELQLVELETTLADMLRGHDTIQEDQDEARRVVDAIRADTAIGNAEKELLQVASVPLYKILTVQAAYGRGMPTDDRDTLAEIASIDLLYAILDRIVSEAGRSMASFIAADEAKLAIWRGQVAEVRSGLVQRQATGQAKVSAIMQIIEKTAMIENALAASMSPSMSAALDWSRGLQSRSIVP